MLKLIFLYNATYMLNVESKGKWIETITIDLEDPQQWEIIKKLYEIGVKENGN